MACELFGGVRRGRAKFPAARKEIPTYIDIYAEIGLFHLLASCVAKPSIRSVQDPGVYGMWGLVFAVHTPGAGRTVGCTSF